MATVEGDANSEFSAALTSSLDKSLKDEQTNASEGSLAYKKQF